MDKMEKYIPTVSDYQVPIISQYAIVNQTEENLRNLFKCTYNMIESENKPCYAVRYTSNGFLDHLKTIHPSPKQTYCCYCAHYNNEEITMLSHEDLVNHIKSKHRFRIYQCNLCIFRAISAFHLNIHQRIIHPEIYVSTVFNDNTVEERCKILECTPLFDSYIPEPKDSYYISKAHMRLNNIEPNEKFYQCLYCIFMNDSKFKVVEHCVQKHPDYFVMYYIPESLVSSSNKSLKIKNN